MSMAGRLISTRCKETVFQYRGVLTRSNFHAYPNIAELLNKQIGNGSVHPVILQGSSLSFHTSACFRALDDPSKSDNPFSNSYGGFRSLSSASTMLEGSSVAASSKGVPRTIQQYGQCFWELSKSRLSMLVAATAGAGFVLGSAEVINWASLCSTSLGTFMVAASANSFNQIMETKNDSLMKRTMGRPLPSGRLSKSSAALWATAMGSLGTLLLVSEANYLTAGLAFSNLALYTLLYTPLKQIHPINTWVGAVVGAIPPLIGWTAATGGISLEGLVLPAVLYFWQLPHFMSLAYLCRNDYATGGFKMFSLFDITGRRTALVALRNCAYLLLVAYFTKNWNMTSMWFGVETTLLTTGMGAAALLFYLNPNRERAKRLFLASLLYLPLLMVGLVIHRIPNVQDGKNSALSLDDQLRSEQKASTKKALDKEEKLILTYPNYSLQPRSPVAYASVAPFPFLPVPIFDPDDQ